MSAPDLTPREHELIRAFVAAWEESAHEPFDFGHGPFEYPEWPPDVPAPSRDEVRRLVLLNLLGTNRSVAPLWRVFPSADARRMFGAGADLADALGDADRRLGVLLEATVAAFEADPSEPVHFAPMEQAALVSHAHWPIQPDVVRAHDLHQLEDLGLIATAPRGRDTSFWPTPDGRAAVTDAAGYLERVALTTDDATEKSRLRGWAERLRAGDVAVGTVAGSASGALIRALMGL